MLHELQALFGAQYTVERELGGGGMSRVFVARDGKLDRRIVIKVLPPELSGALGVDRFRREIRIAAQLRHPHIVPLLDAGEVKGMLYYTMPFIDGESLRARLKRETSLPLGEAVRLSAEVADALAYAHAQGIVHRDIKPENILLDSGHAVVADFGIARAIRQSDSSSLTLTGLGLGTPAYMSPEQFVEASDIDGRTDIYSLGCVLYEMVVGKPPLAQVAIAKAGEQEAALRTLLPIFAKALAQDPSKRYESATSFHTALTHVNSRSRVHSMVGLIAAGLIAAVGTFGWVSTHRSTDSGVVPETTHGQVTFVGNARWPAISRDGKWLAYKSAGKLMIHDLLTESAHAIDAPGCCWGIQWMPDGGDLIYGDERGKSPDAFIRVPRSGGTFHVAATARGVSFWTLQPDGQSILTFSNKGVDSVVKLGLQIVRIPLDQRKRPDTLRLRTPIDWVDAVAISPSGAWIALVGYQQRSDSIDGPELLQMISVNGRSMPPETLHVNARHSNRHQTFVRWSSSGDSLFIADSAQSGFRPGNLALIKRSFNPVSGVLGSSVPVLSIPQGARDISVAGDNTQAAFTAIGVPKSSVALVRLSTKSDSSVQWIRRGTMTYDMPDISPDGTRLAYGQSTIAGYDLRIATITDSAPRRIARILHSDSVCIASLRWSPTGDRLAYTARSHNGSAIIVLDTMGTVLTRTPVKGAVGCGISGPYGRLVWLSKANALWYLAIDSVVAGHVSYSRHLLNLRTGADTAILQSTSGGPYMENSMPVASSHADSSLISIGRDFVMVQTGVPLKGSFHNLIYSRSRIDIAPVRWGTDGRIYYVRNGVLSELWSMRIDGSDDRIVRAFPGPCSWISLDARPEHAVCQILQSDGPDVWLARRGDQKH